MLLSPQNKVASIFRLAALLVVILLTSETILSQNISSQAPTPSPKQAYDASPNQTNTYLASKLNVTSRRVQKNRKLEKPEPIINATSPNYRCEPDLSLAVEICAKPLMAIIEGTIEKWPQTVPDAYELCKSFATAERCIKDVARKCAKGLQKAIFSTFATSVGRARKQECAGDKVNNILKMTKCVEKNQRQIHALMANVTSRLNHLRTKIPDPSQKISGLCCMVHNTEHNIRDILEPVCAEESKTVLRLYRSVLEDVLELICREARQCFELFTNYIARQDLKYDGGLISSIVRLLSQLE